jgi:hypothetical protein
MIITGNPAEVAAAYIAACVDIQTQLVNDGKANRNTYPTLANVLVTVKPILLAHGLTVTQEPTSNEFGVGVSTVIMHKSGGTIDFRPLTMQPADLKPQTVGSTITYCRRYALMSVLGLVGGGEDDDGAQGTFGEKPKVAPATNGHSHGLRPAGEHDDTLWDTPAAHAKAPNAATPAQVKRANSLGVKFYGTELWQTKMPGIVAGASKGSAKTMEALKDVEIDRVITGLDKLITERAAQLQAAAN